MSQVFRQTTWRCFMATNQETLVAHLAALTGDLQPTEQGTAEDLDLARAMLARALARGQTEPLARLTAGERAASTSPAIISQEQVRANLVAIAERAMSETTAGQPEFLIYRREIPVMTTQEPGSLPLWAAGRAIDRTLGSFRDALGRPIWFDIFNIVSQVALVRNQGGAPFLTLPVQGLAFSGSSFTLGPGSLWFASQLLAA